MLPSDSTSDEISPVDMEERIKQRSKVFNNFVEKITPWLFSFGNWIFGGLIAFNLLVIASLITVGPGRLVILIAITTFACDLPLNVTGLFLLKLTQDMNEVAIDDLMRQAFQDADIPDIEVYFPAIQEAPHKKRTNTALRYSIGIAALSMMLTVIGMVATLWYMAWWVAVIFLAMVILSFALLIFVFTRSMPPETEAEKELKKRYREQRGQQGKGQRK